MTTMALRAPSYPASDAATDDWFDAEPETTEMTSAFDRVEFHPRTPTVVRDLVEDAMDRSHMIEFPDEGERYAADFGDDFTPLSAMSLMKYAISNCHAASWAILETMCLPELQLIGTRYEKNPYSDKPLSMNCHYAVLVRDEDADEDWVVDFTARQFSKAEAFPLVMPVAQWKQRIDQHVERLFEQKPGLVVLEG